MSSCRRRSDESVNKRLVCKPRRRPPSSCQQRSDESLTASCVQATTLNKSLVCKLRRSTSSFQRCSDESENQRLRCASHDDADGLLSSCLQRGDESENQRLVCKLRRPTSSCQQRSNESENQRRVCKPRRRTRRRRPPSSCPQRGYESQTSVLCISHDNPRNPFADSLRSDESIDVLFQVLVPAPCVQATTATEFVPALFCEFPLRCAVKSCQPHSAKNVTWCLILDFIT